jgi:hypothetical protein
MPQSIRSGSSFDSLIPALTDNADIVKALKDYHYGTISYPTTQGQEDALTTGIVGLFNSKIGASAPTFTGTVTIAGQDSQFPVNLSIGESTHATSKRVAINLGTIWQIGQDGTGGVAASEIRRNFYIYGGTSPASRFEIATDGSVSIPNNSLNVGTATTNGAYRIQASATNAGLGLVSSSSAGSNNGSWIDFVNSSYTQTIRGNIYYNYVTDALVFGTSATGSTGARADRVTINSTGTTFTGTATIPTIVSNTINATSVGSTSPSLYPNTTTGTISIGNGLTTGTLNISSNDSGVKTINIGNSTSTVNITSFINTNGIVRPNNTTNGSGGSISLQAGSYTANGAPGDVTINAGGGPSTGVVSIQGAQGNTGDIYLGNAGSTTTVGGDLSLSTGISGIVYKAQPVPEGVSSGGTLTWTEVKSLIILSQPSSSINLNLPAASSNSSITTDGYSFDWSIVNKSGANAVTVVAVATNTLDGTGLIPANSSGRFTTRRVSSTSYKTYRIA